MYKPETSKMGIEEVKSGKTPAYKNKNPLYSAL